MKKAILILLLAMMFTLSACSSSRQAPTDLSKESQTLTESAEPSNTDSPSLQPDETPKPQTDWRDDVAISARGTMVLEGESIDVCVYVEDEQILFYRDEATQALLAQGDYPIHLENAAESFEACDFEDIDQDGNSDLTVNFAFPDGSQAIFLWFWVDGQGYVLNEEFSQLPGEGNQ